MESMSKKEKLARGSAVIKVMKVQPRCGYFVRNYVDVHKLPRKPKPPNAPKGVLADMPWLNVKAATFELLTTSARIDPPYTGYSINKKGPCDIEEDDMTKGLPDGHKMIKWFGYREWIQSVSPAHDGSIAEHFNIMLGVIMSMAVDQENESFVDVEAFPCVQFLRTIKTPEGEIPTNISRLIVYIEFVCQKLLDEG